MTYLKEKKNCTFEECPDFLSFVHSEQMNFLFFTAFIAVGIVGRHLTETRSKSDLETSVKGHRSLPSDLLLLHLFNSELMTLDSACCSSRSR